MKNHTWKLAVVVVAVGLAGGCKSARSKAFAARMQPPAGGGPQIMIVQPPENQVKEAGTLAHFHVGVAPPASIVYQWRRDGVDIPGATNDSFTITPVSMADVGTYSVRARKSTETNEVSATAYLSVYTLWTTNSNGGTLSAPVGLFTSSYAYTCGGTAFTYGWPPQSSTGPLYFYGPEAAAQSGPFVNSSRSSTLIVHTMHPDNGGATTGIRLRKNYWPMDDFGCAFTPPGSSGARLGPATLPLGTNKKYIPTFFYLTPAPASGKVSFGWTYYN